MLRGGGLASVGLAPGLIGHPSLLYVPVLTHLPLLGIWDSWDLVRSCQTSFVLGHREVPSPCMFGCCTEHPEDPIRQDAGLVPVGSRQGPL